MGDAPTIPNDYDDDNVTVYYIAGKEGWGTFYAGCRTATFIPTQTPIITSAAIATATVGQLFSYTITANNTPTSFNATGLPAGLTVNTATGVISGTPTTASTSTITISASNVTGTGTLTLTLTVKPKIQIPGITSAATATATVGQSFTYNITASNTPTSFVAANLPTGLSINQNTGVISGTPTTAGTKSVTISAINTGGTGTKILTLTVNPLAPVITSAATATATVDQSFSYTITANNTPTSFAATGLPTGLSLNTTSGLISGTPTAAGTKSVTISAINGGGTGTKTLTLTVKLLPPLITSAATAAATVGQSFSYTITANNTPTSFAATGLPAGLSVNTTSGLISGTPTAAGTKSVTISAINTAGTGSKTLTVTVNIPSVVPAFLFSTNAGKITITGSNPKASGNLVIPATINNLPVTSIGNFAFSGSTGLKSVTLPSSVISVRAGAFSGCTELTNITIPNSVTSIGASAFAHCSGLTSVTIPNKVTEIADYVFGRCSKLTTVTIPNSVTSIRDEAFYGCTGLKSLTIPSSVSSIRSWAFEDCTSLTNVTFMGNAPTVGSEVFAGTSATIYYIQGKTGWSTTFADRPTATFIPPAAPIVPPGSPMSVTVAATVADADIDPVTFSKAKATPANLAAQSTVDTIQPAAITINYDVAQNKFVVRVQGDANQEGVIEYTDNFQSWTALPTKVVGSTDLTLIDPQATNKTHRFYRVFKR